MDKFPCTSCGACCRRVHLLTDFPEPINDDGSCSHLQADNTCAIYDRRPLICNVDAFYERFLTEAMTRQEFYRQNIEVCNLYQQEDRKA